MKKAQDLRAHLAENVPALAKDPHGLHVFIEKGRVACRYGDTLSFEYRYEIQILVTDFADHADTITIPVLAWVATNQPDILLNTERQENVLRFEAEIIDHEKADISYTIEVSERVVVNFDGVTYTATHHGEPPLDELTGPAPWSIFLKGAPIESA